MKKIYLMAVVLFLAISLVACGSNSFTPEGEKATSKGGTVSVLAPDEKYDMWKNIKWTVNEKYSDNSIEIRAEKESKNSSLFYVRPGIWQQGSSYKTVEDLEAQLKSGKYVEEHSSYDKGEKVNIAGKELWLLTKEGSYDQYLLLRDNKVFGIQARLSDNEFQAVYENLLKQVVLTIE